MMSVKKQDGQESGLHSAQRDEVKTGGDSKVVAFFKSIDYLKLFVSLAIPLVAGGLVGALTGPYTRPLFDSIEKPPLMPPQIVFPIVWTVLYALMGIAFYLVWTADTERGRGGAFAAYFVQLALNIAWPIVFFVTGQFSVAVGIILALMIAIAVCMELFTKFNPAAGKLLIPYLVWTAFATYLNISIALIN